MGGKSGFGPKQTILKYLQKIKISMKWDWYSTQLFFNNVSNEK